MKNILIATLALLLVSLACEPVFAIGWGELLVLIVIIAFLLGPLMLRIYRLLGRLQQASKSEEDKKKK